MRIGLVFGGNTTEGEVSKKSAEGVRGALKKLDYEIVDIEYDKNIAMHIQDANVDIIFNAMHGQYGEDGCLQGLLNIMQIPYTHSGLLPTSISMNKQICKEIFKNLGLKVPEGIVVSKEDLQTDQWKEMIKNSNLKDCKEVFVKPVCDGSSRDVFLVHNIEEYSFKTTEFTTASNNFLIEKRTIGREIQVAVIGNEAVGLLEIIPNSEQSEFYDYTAKYTDGGAKHVVPDLPENIKNELLLSAQKIHNTIGLKDLSRSEFLLTDNNEIYVLEVNSNPGLTQLSIVPEIARNANISYEQIVELLVKNAKYN